MAITKKTDYTNCCEMWRTWNFHTLLVVMQNGMTTLKNTEAVSVKTKHMPAMYSSHSIPRYLLKSKGKTYVHTRPARDSPLGLYSPYPQTENVH